MNKVLFPVIIAIMFAGLANAAECRKVIITSDPEYPPISWRDSENPKKIIGVAIELSEMAFMEMGIAFESRYVGPWERVLRNAEYGKVDMIAGIYLNEKRKKYLDYIFPSCMKDPSVIFVMKGRTFRFEKWEDLIGLTGGIRIGDSFGETFDRFEKEKLKIERVKSFNTLFKKLQHGRNRYFVYGLYPGLAYAEELGVRDKLEYLSKPITDEKIYIAFSKKSMCKTYQEIFGKKMEKYIQNRIPDILTEKYIKIWKKQAESGFKQHVD
jgi:polar amino acid transport system substrate-binding protein